MKDILGYTYKGDYGTLRRFLELCALPDAVLNHPEEFFTAPEETADSLFRILLPEGEGESEQIESLRKSLTVTELSENGMEIARIRLYPIRNNAGLYNYKSEIYAILYKEKPYYYMTESDGIPGFSNSSVISQIMRVTDKAGAEEVRWVQWPKCEIENEKDSLSTVEKLLDRKEIPDRYGETVRYSVRKAVSE